MGTPRLFLLQARIGSEVLECEPYHDYEDAVAHLDLMREKWATDALTDLIRIIIIPR